MKKIKRIPVFRAFSKQAEDQQIAWRSRQTSFPAENGIQNGFKRTHILPADKWQLGVWEPIRRDLECYLSCTGVQAHEGKHNLKSSWIQCANLFFPFRVNIDANRMMASFLSRELGLQVETIDKVEFEYAGEGKLSPRQLLGEEKGKRGSGQTSPDLAITFTCDDSKCGIYLIENKYTEHHFYPCSAAQKTINKKHSEKGLSPNPNPQRCCNITELLSDVNSHCHQIAWGRKYWPVLKNNVYEGIKKLSCCPAMTDGYQLLRQQALAQGFLNSGMFDYVISGVAYDERNTELIQCLKTTGCTDFRVGWPTLFKSSVRFHCFSHQAFVHWVTRSKVAYITKWGEYIMDRYGVNYG